MSTRAEALRQRLIGGATGDHAMPWDRPEPRRRHREADDAPWQADAEVVRMEKARAFALRLCDGASAGEILAREYLNAQMQPGWWARYAGAPGQAKRLVAGFLAVTTKRQLDLIAGARVDAPAGWEGI